MARKKLSDMTPIERANKLQKGFLLEQAEETGVEILARVLSVHIYARHEGEEYLDRLSRRICDRADEWAHSEEGTVALAFAAVAHNHEKKEQESLNTQQNE